LLNDSASLHSGGFSLAGYADIFYATPCSPGVVPDQRDHGTVRRRFIRCLTDFCGDGATAYMFITGPDVVQAATNEKSLRAIGADVHAEIWGQPLAADSDAGALYLVQNAILIPQNNMENCPLCRTTRAWRKLAALRRSQQTKEGDPPGG
jgi:hypothetical protein